MGHNSCMAGQQDVYLLWHGDDIHDDTPDALLLGVYSSERAALDRISQAILLPGFRDHPDDFRISCYTIDQDEWTSGYTQTSPPAVK